MGEFYFDKNKREGYWFDSESKQLWQLESEKFCSFLSDRMDLNQKDKAFDWILSALKDRVSQHAPKVEPQIYSFFDERRFILYVNNKAGRALQIDSNSVREIDNGEGCLFLWDVPVALKLPFVLDAETRKLFFENARCPTALWNLRERISNFIVAQG